MTKPSRWTIRATAGLLSASLVILPGSVAVATAAPAFDQGAPVSGPRAQRPSQPRAKRPPPANVAPPSAASATKELPPRIPFTAQEDATAVIPGIPEARFWADSVVDFKNALPAQPGPWLVLSSGGADGAFGAGVLNGLSAAGKR